LKYRGIKPFLACGLPLIICCCMLFAINGCKVYSFSGANIPPDIHSFSVELFQNRASTGPASLPQSFTDRLKLKFQTEGGLKQASSDGDLQFKGAITGYSITSDAAVANTTSALLRLTITVQVDFTNTKNEKDKWSETFSRYAQVPSTENISSVEGALIDEINRQLVDDIFQKALVKW
jgi:hypothetical protein